MVLLAIYAFITMPVQVWHSHTAPAAEAGHVWQKANFAGSSHFSEDTSEGSCNICDHHYSAYSGETVFLLPQIAKAIYLPAGFLLFTIPDTHVPGSCNKGPPASC